VTDRAKLWKRVNEISKNGHVRFATPNPPRGGRGHLKQKTKNNEQQTKNNVQLFNFSKYTLMYGIQRI
jgi:hypothetical protein